MEFDYTNLRAFIKEHFHNLKEFAHFLGIGTTQLGQRLRNEQTKYHSLKEKLIEWPTIWNVGSWI